MSYFSKCIFLFVIFSCLQKTYTKESLSTFGQCDICDITSVGKIAQSAFKRAKSEECKQKILQTACMNDNLYPKELKSSCDLNKTYDVQPKKPNKVTVAYLLMVHGRSVRQVLRLFYRLEDICSMF